LIETVLQFFLGGWGSMEEGKRSLAVDDVIGNKANMMATAPVNWQRRNRYRSTLLRKNA
jgi:hypothetical protein